jgi:hypothetical protein
VTNTLNITGRLFGIDNASSTLSLVMGTRRHFEATGFNVTGKFNSFFVFTIRFGGHIKERRSRY